MRRIDSPYVAKLYETGSHNEYPVEILGKQGMPFLPMRLSPLETSANRALSPLLETQGQRNRHPFGIPARFEMSTHKWKMVCGYSFQNAKIPRASSDKEKPGDFLYRTHNTAEVIRVSCGPAAVHLQTIYSEVP